MYKQLKVKSMVLPQELKDQKRWCNWRTVNRGGRNTKMPMDSNIQSPVGAKSDDESTWATFETALKRADNRTGMGYFFKEPYIGIDIDDVEDEIHRHLAGDEEDNIVSEFINELDSYTEISPSGTGIHIITKGELPEKGRRKGNVEIYDGRRFFTVTFNSIGPNHIKDDSEIGNIKKLHEKYIRSADDDKPDRPQSTNRQESVGNDLSDREVLTKAFASKNGSKFKQLFEGDTSAYESPSEAEQGFMNILAFWTGKDRDQMDVLYRQSGLMRDKWDEMRGHDTYGNITIQTAIDDVEEVFSTGYTKAQPFVMPDSTTKIKDSWKYNKDEPTREDLDGFPIRSADDTGNAQRLIDRFGDILKFDFFQDEFYVYNGQVWDVDHSGQARRMVDQTVELIEDEDWSQDIDLLQENADKMIEKREKGKAKHVTRSRNLTGKRNMLELVKNYLPVEQEEFDKDPYALNVDNGYIDLRTGTFRQSDKEQMFSMMSNAEYHDGLGEPTRWLKFLDHVFEGDQEVIDFVQRALGYSLTSSTNEHKMFILLGTGRNGKSKFMEVVADIFGSYTKNVQASTLAPKVKGAINDDLARLQNARLVTSSEPQRGFEFDEGLIKQITGDEPVTSRHLYGRLFEYMPDFKVWLTTNYQPVIHGTDDGIWERLIVIPFNVYIPPTERDKDIAIHMLEERDEILNWMIQGAVEWYKYQDLRIPESILSNRAEYRKEMNVFGEFLDENCEVDEELDVKASELWGRYKTWADDGRFRSMNKNEFGIEMKREFESVRKSDGIYYTGVGLL